MGDEGVREGGIGDGDEHELGPSARPGDPKPALVSACGREGRDGLDQAHAQGQHEGEMAEFGRHGSDPAAAVGMLPPSRAISSACATSGGM